MRTSHETMRSSPDARPRVLCVDDEPRVLEGLRDTLRRHFDLRTAVSGAEGLRHLSEDAPFTVVMSDFAMPGMNGAEFLAQARLAAPETARILLTGQATLGNTIDAVNKGNIFRLLMKPCTPADLVQAIEDAVEQARLLTADRALLQRQLDAMSGHLVRAERLASLGTIAGAIGHELANLLMVFGGARTDLEEALAAGAAERDGSRDPVQRGGASRAARAEPPESWTSNAHGRGESDRSESGRLGCARLASAGGPPPSRTTPSGSGIGAVTRPRGENGNRADRDQSREKRRGSCGRRTVPSDRSGQHQTRPGCR